MRPRTSPVLMLLAASVLASGVASATDLHVDAATGDDARDGLGWPTALRTLRQALVVAARFPDADTIHVAEGTYAENLVLDRSDITLLGGYAAGGGARDAAAHPTIVDGQTSGPVVVVSGDSGSRILAGVAIDGFTLRNGRAYVRGGIAGGAGLFVEEAQVQLTNNVIESNVADVLGSRGGGLYLYRAAAGASVIRANRFVSNEAIDGLGGAAWLADFADPAASAPLVFEGNTLRQNVASALVDLDPVSASEHSGNGGGVFAWGGATRFERNTFLENAARATNDRDYNGQGGALFLLDGAPILTGNVLSQNVAEAAGGAFGAAGGAVYLMQVDPAFGGDPTIDGNTFDANLARGGTGTSQGWGGGMNLSLFTGSSPLVTNNVFRSNVALGGGDLDSRGGGVYAFVSPGSGASVALRDTTVEDNAAAFGGGGIWVFSEEDPTTATIDGALVRGNLADFASGVMVLGRADVRNVRIRENALYDPDGDLASEVRDVCPGLFNPVQSDADLDGAGDACDADDDGDGVPDTSDNCPLVVNGAQADADADGTGDACEGDADGDAVADGVDNCPLVANALQEDATFDGEGDACEPEAFDPLETNASGIWLSGDATLTNAEIVENVGQGLEIIGVAADPVRGTSEDPATAVVTNVTLAANAAAGFVTYLATGTAWRDTIIAENEWSDGFDTEKAGGIPSSPGMTCDSVYFGDGVASLPCTGSGNLDADPGSGGGPVLFVPGPLGLYYLSQVLAGQFVDSPALDAGTRLVPTSLSALTTRTDGLPDVGNVDLGYHHAPPGSGDDELAAALRVTREAGTGGGAPALSLVGAAADLASVRLHRGQLDLLGAEYSHASPFSGQAGDPECAWAAGGTFVDAAALRDGRNWYYLAAALRSGFLGAFGDDSLGRPRPRPEDSASDLVVDGCP